MVPEAPLEDTEHGKVAGGEGWYVVNARDATWYDRAARGALCDFEAGQDWPQLGVNLFVLGPGQPMSMYHWEADQEDFLVLSGEALLIVEDEEQHGCRREDRRAEHPQAADEAGDGVRIASAPRARTDRDEHHESADPDHAGEHMREQKPVVERSHG